MNNELWLVWETAIDRQKYKVGVLKKEDNGYVFNYVNGELDEAIKNGFDYFPGFNDLNEEYTNNVLFHIISSRLPNKKRPDYLQILNFYGLNNESNEFEILKKTRGKLLTDRFEFVPPFNQSYLEFEVNRLDTPNISNKNKSSITINKDVKLVIDPSNKKDCNAIKVVLESDEKCILGYVPKYYTRDLIKLLDDKVDYSAMIKSFVNQIELSDEHIMIEVKIIF